MPLPSVSAPWTLFETLALVALLSVAYGTVMRLAWSPLVGHALVGALFGGGALIAMSRSVTLASGASLDLRSVPLVLAGAFLGPHGAAAAVTIALIGRGAQGGSALAAALAGILLAGGLGLLWARCEGPGSRGIAALLRLSALATATLLATVLPPAPLVGPTVTRVWPILLPLLWIGIAASGALLERERRFLAHVGRLSREGEEDALTGLLNRRGFARAVHRERARIARDRWGGGDRRKRGGGILESGGAVILIDIDHFKRINDRHGHPVGDAVLRALGPRLRQVLRKGDIVARIGGEEIAVFLHGRSGPLAAEGVARRLCEAVRDEGFAIPGGPVLAVTASVGGAWAGSAATPLDTLLAQADAALYEAKGAGRDRSRFAPHDEEARPRDRASGPGVAPDPDCDPLSDAARSGGQARASAADRARVRVA